MMGEAERRRPGRRVERPVLTWLCVKPRHVANLFDGLSARCYRALTGEK